jgi:hypothetical protein
MTPVRGGQMNIDHLHDFEFLWLKLTRSTSNSSYISILFQCVQPYFARVFPRARSRHLSLRNPCRIKKDQLPLY